MTWSASEADSQLGSGPLFGEREDVHHLAPATTKLTAPSGAHCPSNKPPVPAMAASKLLVALALMTTAPQAFSPTISLATSSNVLPAGSRTMMPRWTGEERVDSRYWTTAGPRTAFGVATESKS